MDIVTKMIDEIALCGLEGCTFEELWTHLSTQTPLDNALKSYLWKQLLQCTTHVIRLFQTPSPVPLPEPMEVFTFPDGSTKWHQYIPNNTYCYVSDSTHNIKGSCSTYHQRQDITEDIFSLTENEQTLEKIEEKYGKNQIVVVASQSCRERALIQCHIDLVHQLTDICYGLLEIVGKSRHVGIFRVHLTNKYFNIDPRSTFHHVKTLRKLGLITIQVFTLKSDTGSYQQTHVIFLKRFTPTFEQQGYKQVFCDLLLNSPDQTLPVQTLAEKLGSSNYKRLRRSLIQDGYLEEVTCHNIDKDETVKGLKLIKPFGSNSVDTKDNIDNEDTEQDYSTGTLSIVNELPIDAQGFRIIENHKSIGIPMSEFQFKTFAMNPLLCRMIAKSLVKSSIVTTILSDNTAVRTMKLISTKHIKSNKEVEDFVLECAKHECTSVNITANSTTSISPAIRTGKKVFHNYKDTVASTSTSNKKIKLTDQSEQEKDFMEIRSSQSFVTLIHLKRCNNIMEYMEQKRIDEGILGIFKYLRKKENKSGKLIDRKTVIRLLNGLVSNNQLCVQNFLIEIDNDISTTVQIYYIPQVTDNEIVKYKEWIRNVTLQSQINRQSKKSRSKKSVSEKKHKSDSSDNDEEVQDFKHKRTLSKFQRIKHFHCYLWILLHGYQNGFETEQSGNESVSSVLPELIYPWVKAVKMLPEKCGTLSYYDVSFNIPLSLMNILISPGFIKTYYSKYSKYFSDPVLSNLPIHKLPDKLKKIFSIRNYDTNCVIQLLDWLTDMKLITTNGPYRTRKDRTEVLITLNYSLTILDTSNATPTRSYFVQQEKDNFTVFNYTLKSLIDIKQYWESLQYICTNTPITNISEKKREPEEQSSTESTKKRFKIGSSRNEKAEQSKLGFGAGGLPIHFFSHMIKNWTGTCISTPIKKGEEFHGDGGRSFGASEKTVMKLYEGPLSSHSGGKGMKRNRAKKALKNARKVQNMKKQRLTFNSLLSSKSDKTAAASNKSKERSIWHPHEDNFIILSYISALVLHKLGYPPTEQHVLTDALHNQFVKSRDKNVAALHRRLGRLLKKYTVYNLNSTVSEIIDEMKHEDSPVDHTFHSILYFILSRYMSHDGHLINITQKSYNQLLLPLTLEEITDHYQLDKDSSLTSLTQNQNLLLNLLIATVSPVMNNVSSYNVFTILDRFPEADIQIALDHLKSKSYLVKRKSVTDVTRVTSTGGTYIYGVNFNQLFEKPYNKQLFNEIQATALPNLISPSNETKPSVTIETKSLTSGDTAYVVGQAFGQSNYNCEPIFPKSLLINEHSSSSSSNKIITEALEEIDEVEEETTSGTSSYKSGLGTLLDIDHETAELQHGSIVIRPPVNIGCLLDPLDDETPPLLCDLTEQIATVSITLDEFLIIASSSLNYSPVAMTTAKHVYEIVNEAGTAGVTMATLSTLVECDTPLLDTVLQDLINFNLVFVVGTTTPLFVSHAHSKYWSINIDGSVSTIRPWINTNDPNIKLYQQGVLLYIVSNPGISFASLLHHFEFVLQSVSLKEILQNLIAARCVQCHALCETTPTRHSLFCNSKSSFIRSYNYNDPPGSVFYEAVVNAELLWSEHVT